jgi:formylglycine-generating enzyme required for sulfatase activity
MSITSKLSSFVTARKARLSLVTAAFAAFAANAALAAEVSSVIVRQQWPWSTDIKIEVKVTGVTAPFDLSFEAFNGSTALDNSRIASGLAGQDRYGLTEGGVYTYTLDPVTVFETDKVALADFRIKVTATDSPANIHEILYKIVDMTAPFGVTDVRRKDFYNGTYGPYVTSYADIDPEFSTSLDDVLIWTGVTQDDTYKTNKMVFRRIPAAGQSYMFQTNNASVNGGAGVKVSFTNDFYIGVFEVTQGQQTTLQNSTGIWIINRSNETNELYRMTRPLDGQYYTTSLRTRADWPDSTSHDLRSETQHDLISQLQNKTGLIIDLPTEAMWEFACRAGTTTPLYTGAPNQTPVWNGKHSRKIGRGYGCNAPGSTAWADRNCDLSSGPNIVGSYLPNAWGLYDMIGNVKEWCLDRFVADSSLAGITHGLDPVGPTAAQASSDSAGVTRGGAYNENVMGCIGRNSRPRGSNTQNHGVRLCIWLNNHEDGTF